MNTTDKLFNPTCFPYCGKSKIPVYSPLKFMMANIPMMNSMPLIKTVEDGQPIYTSALNYMAFNKYVVVINEEIGNNLTTWLIPTLLALSSLDPSREITIKLTTPGGNTSDGFALFDTLMSIPNPIRVEAQGSVSSFGIIILCAASEGMRFASPNSRLMFHEPRALYNRQMRTCDLKEEYESMKKCEKQAYEIVSARTGIPFEDLTRLLEGRDFYMTPEEALELQFIDEINQFDPSKEKWKTPKNPLNDERLKKKYE